PRLADAASRGPGGSVRDRPVAVLPRPRLGARRGMLAAPWALPDRRQSRLLVRTVFFGQDRAAADHADDDERLLRQADLALVDEECRAGDSGGVFQLPPRGARTSRGGRRSGSWSMRGDLPGGGSAADRGATLTPIRPRRL